MNSTLSKLTKSLENFKNLAPYLKTQEDCIEFLEELVWEGEPVSPYDKTSKVLECRNGKFKCKNTGRFFTVLTGTIFEQSKLPLKVWFLAIYLVQESKDKISATTLANYAGISKQTAWRLLQVIRAAITAENIQYI